MRHTIRRLLGALLVALCCTAIASQETETETAPRVQYGDRVSVFGGEVHVAADEFRRGSVICVACDSVRIEGAVGGQVVVILSSLDMTGSSRDGVVGVLSDLRFEGAEIGQQLINVLGTLRQRDSEVSGQTVNIGLGEWFPGSGLWSGSLFEFFFWLRLLGLLAVFVTVLLLVALVPDRIRLMADEAPVRYAVAFFVGLLAYAAYPLVLILLSITVVGAPVWYLGFKVLKWMGGAALLYLLGRRLGRGIGREMSLAGGVSLGFVIYAALSLLPLLGGVIGYLLGWIVSAFLFLFIQVPAIGLVILTRAGGKVSTPQTPPDASQEVLPAQPG